MVDSSRTKTALWRGFAESAQQFADRPAISVSRDVSYAELADRAQRIAATIQERRSGKAPPLTAVFAYRSETAYAAVLGSLMAGDGYVPLNRTFPSNRTRLMLLRSGCESIVIDSTSQAQVDEILAGIDRSLVLILPDCADISGLAARHPLHRFVGGNQLAPAERWEPVDTSGDSIAYLLFTSGSTGEPKGVAVSHANALHYVAYVTRRYQFTPEDRFSQTFDFTFDLSVHDMFVAWHNGACVCCPRQKQLIKPGAFIDDARLSVWFSVPSMAAFMRRFGVLKPGMYPRLRLSLFCGEALPLEIIRDWTLAAPNSVIENIYGPTELTIACTAYRWDHATSSKECEHGIVPIGEPFDNMKALIVDPHLHAVKDGQDGELLMTGPQLSLGYWRDEEKTKRAFVQIPGEEGLFYRTGDRVRRRGPGQPLLYLGRLDSQIKVLGHRVELGEVEAAIRQASGVDAVVALAWPVSESGADGIEAFVETENLDVARLLTQLKSTLPFYMVPRKIRLLNRFALNPNGKVDRGALHKKLDEEEHRTRAAR